PYLPPEAAGWDVSAVTAEELGAARSFLDRRQGLTPEARLQVATALAGRLHAKVAGVPVNDGPERFLELVVTAKLSR
ncbi:MAG: hypothetical protein JWN46_3726, partial [Acidimicrobiales bacterium]|nr:hypothetical protein [Acidimicrobiales bacterium]